MKPKKKRNKKHAPRRINPALAWRDMRIIMFGKSCAEQDPDVHRGLMLAGYAELEKLRTGMMETDGFVMLSTINLFGAYLANEIAPQLDDDSRAAVMRAQTDFESAADALASIGERYRKTGKYGASGPEIQALRTSMGHIDNFIAFANVGQTVRSLKAADADVERMWRAAGKAAKQTGTQPVF